MFKTKASICSNSPLIFCLGLGLGQLISLSANATGYYNFGAHWKGGLNPYRLGAEGVIQSGFTSGISSPGHGNGDGALYSPTGIARDSSGNIYVADAGNHRISKYSSSGTFQGWIGKIATSPTGGAAGCAGAGVGTFTPGWCTGGTATSGSGDGMMNTPYGMALDLSGNLYIADYGNSRINKYSSTGAFQGWIGQIATPPTGGATGCAGAAAGTITPGWCTGGTSQSGAVGDGSMDQPLALALDPSGNLYVADGHNNRIDKYNSSGAFQGWIGIVYFSSPTGGAAGCTTTSAGSFTPGWCVGGTSDYSYLSGGLHRPAGVALDSLGNIYVSSTFDDRVTKYDSSGVYQGWIGTIGGVPTGGASGCTSAANKALTPGWCMGGSPDGNFPSIGPVQPWGLAVDSSDNLYVVDMNQHRIIKYDSSGAFKGWIGKVGTTPTGGAAGCASAAVGTFTPGWCTGGSPAPGSGDGMLTNPTAMTLDPSGNLYIADKGNSRISKYDSSGTFAGAIQSASTYFSWHRSSLMSISGSGDGMLYQPKGIARDSSGNLYVVDASNNRINKYNASGVFQGWIGKIATAPTGGASGCSAGAVGTFTPGWCKGGTSASGTTGDGSLNFPAFVAVDSSGNLYVADASNYRINKYDPFGVFQGWIGGVNASPTGGAAGCTTTTTSNPTPGWCIGGTAKSASGDGMFWAPVGIAIDPSGNIYVSDSANHRVSKYNASGVFQGWIGKISTSPTGGATGCAGAAVGTFTPGWCTGGAPNSGSGDGMMNGPNGIGLDSSGNLYVVDGSNSRISKYNSASGAFLGWIGKIGTSPTGGASGCAGASVGTFTPGWCTGGTSASGIGDGMLSSPYGIVLDASGSIYVSDQSNARISKYTSSGAFVGWIGKVGASPTSGATGCNGATIGSMTQGWCKGGTAASGSGDGAMASPYGLALDSSGNLYVVDWSNNNILRFSIQGR